MNCMLNDDLFSNELITIENLLQPCMLCNNNNISYVNGMIIPHCSCVSQRKIPQREQLIRFSIMCNRLPTKSKTRVYKSMRFFLPLSFNNRRWTRMFIMSFAGKSAIVTGGSSGIGFYSCRHLLIQGVTVRNTKNIIMLNSSDDRLLLFVAKYKIVYKTISFPYRN